MENICCVCLEETQKVTNCNHFLCSSCYSNMYGKKCPMCRQSITKSSYKKIKKVKHEPEIVDYSTGLTNEEFNRVMFFRALQNTTNEEMELLNQNINRQFQEIVSNCPRGQYIDLSESYITFSLIPK